MDGLNVAVVVMGVITVAAISGSQAQLGASCVDANRLVGRCTSIRSCQPLLELLVQLRANAAPPNALSVLRGSLCPLRGNRELLVCCAGAGGGGGGGSNFNTPPAAAPSPPRGSTSLLPSRCGITGLTDRIVDGEDAPLLAWPWMALLRGKVRGQPSTWFCGGVLISDRYILTAAHCLKPSLRVDLEFVRLGEHTLSKNPDCENRLCAPPPQDIPVEQIILHPQYESPCRECNDIALLRLSRRVRLHNIHVVPVCLPVDPLRDMGYTEQEFQGKFAFAAGWGSTSRNPNRFQRPDVLQQVLLPINEGGFCSTLKRGYPDPRSTLCAGGSGQDTCKGDSGGPLVLSNRVETRRFVVGITSLGHVVCGRQDTQALYTNVHYYVPWILQNLRP